MNMQIFHLIKYDLNDHWRSQNVTFMFILTLTYVLIDNFLSLYFCIFCCYERRSQKVKANNLKWEMQQYLLSYYYHTSLESNKFREINKKKKEKMKQRAITAGVASKGQSFKRSNIKKSNYKRSNFQKVQYQKGQFSKGSIFNRSNS